MREVHDLKFGGKRDHFVKLDAADLADEAKRRGVFWHGAGWYGMGFDECLRCCRDGDLSLVKDSEALLSKLEDQIPLSRGWKTVEDVVGAVPNIPAFLAGHPQHMRRRARVTNETSPLSILMDVTSSGAISPKNLRKRGITLLALTRLLSNVRPVELWISVAMDDSCRGSSTVMWKVETTPLDLARAGHVIGSPAVARGIGYKLIENATGSRGAWPYEDFERHIETLPERVKQIFPGSEMMIIPPIHVEDEMINEPEVWLKREMKKYVEP